MEGAGIIRSALGRGEKLLVERIFAIVVIHDGYMSR